MISYFSDYIDSHKQKGELVVQPRMGFSRYKLMKQGLRATQRANAVTVGTLTLDSYTRVGDYEAATLALQNNQDINGYPIVSYGAEKTQRLLHGLQSASFPVQVRHGTALPLRVFQEMVDSNIDATEGGPVSYCLPYSQLPLKDAMQGWEAAVSHLASSQNILAHIESFAGCMLGQLCPPSLLIALNILECLFFKELGIQSVSLSYAQGTNLIQDYSALRVLRHLADKYLSDMRWHVVVYSYMGVFPNTFDGANKLIQNSASLASMTGCERLIVKTKVESQRIPLISENVEALALAYAASKQRLDLSFDNDEYLVILKEAENLIQAVLSENVDLSEAMLEAFKKGILDVPYCLHKDNKGLAKTIIDKKGYLKWANVGEMPLSLERNQKQAVTANAFLEMLSYVKQHYDEGV